MSSRQTRLRPVDPEDEAAFADFYDVLIASQVHDRPGTFTPPGAEATRDDYLRAPGNRRNSLFALYDADTAVAAGGLHLELTANRHLAALSVHVRPGRRRLGFGSALLGRLEAEATKAGRTTFYVETNLPPGAVVEESAPYKFADSRGYRLALLEQRRQLDLPVRVDLRALADEAAAHHHGYRIVAFRGGVPDDYLKGFATLMALLDAEAPTGEVYVEPGDPDPELVRQREAVHFDRGEAAFGAVALSPDGEVVAATRIWEETGDATKLSQGGTIVRREHRGHRLGLAVKIANLRQLGSSHASVTTWNALANRPMVAINEALGFRLIEQGAGYQKAVSAAP
jgi:GNAT superfamily N-acetyltransferase